MFSKIFQEYFREMEKKSHAQKKRKKQEECSKFKRDEAKILSNTLLHNSTIMHKNNTIYQWKCIEKYRSLHDTLKGNSRRDARNSRGRADPIPEERASCSHSLQPRPLMPRWRNRVFCFSRGEIRRARLSVVIVVFVLGFSETRSRSGAIKQTVLFSPLPVRGVSSRRLYNYSLGNNSTTLASVYRCARVHVCRRAHVHVRTGRRRRQALRGWEWVHRTPAAADLPLRLLGETQGDPSTGAAICPSLYFFISFFLSFVSRVHSSLSLSLFLWPSFSISQSRTYIWSGLISSSVPLNSSPDLSVEEAEERGGFVEWHSKKVQSLLVFRVVELASFRDNSVVPPTGLLRDALRTLRRGIQWGASHFHKNFPE